MYNSRQPSTIHHHTCTYLITVLEGGLLVGVAGVLALPASLLLAYSIGQTRSFLDFSLATDLRVGLTWSSARYGLLVVVLALGALVLPVLGSARHTIVTYKRERARSLRRPWWQRIWLDLWLLIPAGYGTYILSQQGSILRRADDVPADAFEDPLLFLVPALAVCALALLLLRLLPLVLRLLAWAAGYLRSVGLLLAARQLARAAGFYATPLGLLIVTLSLSVYTASLAATLDSHLHDQQYYLVGADASLVDLGDDPSAWSGSGGGSEGGAQSWNFAPISSYLYIPGVEAATRVGRYDALVQTGNSYRPATYLGVDRVALGEVAFWRRDFSAEPLGALMNRLAATQDGVLLPEAFADEQLLAIGDRVNVVIKAFGQSATVPLTYVGPLELFPTWYPGPDDDGVLVLGNLDYLFDTAMTQMPSRVWLKTSGPVDEAWLKEQAFEISLGAQAVMAAGPRVQAEQSRPERQGLLGLLSVGFGAAAFLAALGFVLYALFTFRRRSVELGVMRAMGVSTGQLTLYVVCELGFLLLVGGAAGTGLGVLSSHTFIPFLQIGTEATARYPPFVVEIAWPALLRVYALFGVIYLLALIVLVRSLMRMRLFDAIKMGEAV